MSTQRVFSFYLALLFLFYAVTGLAQKKEQPVPRKYVDGGFYELNYIGREKEEFEKTKEKVRKFIWEQWQRKQAAYIIVRDCGMYPEGCNDSTTYSFYLEPDANGVWQITEKYDHLHTALPPFTTQDEHREGVMSYSKVEKLKIGKVSPCPLLLSESLAESLGQHPTDVRLKLTKSQSSSGQTESPCATL